MSDPAHVFVRPSGSEIHDALGVSVFFVLSDMPWSFSATAGGGEVVQVWVTELPDTVDINVVVRVDGVVTFTSFRGAASRLAVSAHAPEIIIESGSGATLARLEISLMPRLLLSDAVRRTGD